MRSADRFLADTGDLLAAHDSKRAFDNLFAGWEQGAAYADALKAWDDFVEWNDEQRQQARERGEVHYSSQERYEGESDELLAERNRLYDEFEGPQRKVGTTQISFIHPEDADPDGPERASDKGHYAFLPTFKHSSAADRDAYAYSCAFFGERVKVEESYGDVALVPDRWEEFQSDTARYAFWEKVRRTVREMREEQSWR